MVAGGKEGVRPVNEEGPISNKKKGTGFGHPPLGGKWTGGLHPLPARQCDGCGMPGTHLYDDSMRHPDGGGGTTSPTVPPRGCLRRFQEAIIRNIAANRHN